MDRKMCRICLATSNLTPLFTGLSEDGKLSEFLSILTGLEIKLNDSLPQSICLTCRDCINKASHLRVTSQRSHQRLLEMGFGEDAEYGMLEIDEVKCELDYDESVFSNSCDGLPLKTENETNLPTKVKKENKKIKTKIKKKAKEPKLRKNSFNMITLKEPIRVVGAYCGEEDSLQKEKCLSKEKCLQKEKCLSKEKSLSKESCVQKEKKLLKGKTEKKDRFKFGSKQKTTQKYLNLVKGEYDPKGPVQCKICNKTVSKWASFTSHVRIHLGIKFVCEHCGKKFVTRVSMDRHCRSQHGMEKVLKCPHCPFEAIDSTYLKHHTRREHTGERPYICDYCSASYFSRRCLIQHIDSHLTSATVQCEQCSQFFKSKRHLSRHKFHVHTCKLFTYQCPACKQVYKSAKYVRVHLRKAHSLSAREHKIIKTKL